MTLLPNTTMAFSSGGLHHASDLRADPAWITSQQRKGTFSSFWQSKPLIAGNKAVFLPWRKEWEAATCVFLGIEGTQAFFAVALETEGQADTGAFTEMRAAAFVLSPRDCAIAGEARALLEWHQRHGYCPNCGSKTEMRDGGWKRICSQCDAEHFPRTDPVVIMLPIFEDKCLVGRNARFSGGLFSAFAGFVEPGETMEDAVRRELLEEVNLKIGNVRYFKSQPWPFPYSLMLGCYVEALTLDFRIDGEEIIDARWLTKDEARQRLVGAGKDGTTMPAPIAIAHHLIRNWAESEIVLSPPSFLEKDYRRGG